MGSKYFPRNQELLERSRVTRNTRAHQEEIPLNMRKKYFCQKQVGQVMLVELVLPVSRRVGVGQAHAKATRPGAR